MIATKVLNDNTRQQITDAIAEVEKKTTAEIVCAVATESGRYDRAESLIGLFCALASLCAAHGVHAGWMRSAGEWSAAPGLHLGFQVLAVVAGFILGSVLASYAHGFRRLVVSQRESDEEVDRAASHVFSQASLGSTSKGTGLLIYVSLFEHRVVILADDQVREALTDQQIEALRDTAVAGLKKHEFTDTFVQTVQQAGELLAETLPADRDLNPDELPNHVLTFHPRP